MNSIHDGQLIQPDGDEGACDHDGCEERATRIARDASDGTGYCDRVLCDEHARPFLTEPLDADAEAARRE